MDAARVDANYGQAGVRDLVKKRESNRKYAARHRDEINEKSRKYVAEHPEERKETHRKYNAKNRAEHPERVREINRKHYAKYRDELCEKARKYRAEHREKIKERAHKHYAENRDELCEKARKYVAENREEINERQRKCNVERRVRVLWTYGSRCVCCGESRYEFLAIDHVNGDGAAHRHKIGKGGSSFYAWLIKNNFPEGFQILCWNCNWAKGVYGKCPHKEEREA